MPTFAEQGFAELDLTTWYGLWGPANMPTALTKQIYDEVSKVLATPDVRRRIQDALAEPMGENPEKFNVFCHSEAKRYAQIVKAAGIKID